MEKELNYLSLILSDLPCGDYYEHGLKIKIRAAIVEEIEHYSMVDINNLEDIEEKLEQLLKNNVLIKDNYDNVYDYTHLKEKDREYLYFIIRELTFQKGNSLANDAECERCGNKFKIYYRTTKNHTHNKSIYNISLDEKLSQYYDEKEKLFKILINNKLFKLCPPTIGVTKNLKIFEEKYDEKLPSLLYFLLPHKNIISEDTIFLIKSFITGLEMKEFQILSKFITRLKVGIGVLKKTCPKCGEEHESRLITPNLVQLFSLFQIDLGVLLQNEFEFWWQKQMSPSELGKMQYWKYEEFVKMLNKRLEEDAKKQKEQNDQQNSNKQKMPEHKIPKYNIPKV